jgi:hypothetical protein
VGIEIKRQDPKPSTEPIETITLKGVGGRTITVRPTSSDPLGAHSGVRTVDCQWPKGGSQFKWAATLGDLRTFGQALIDMADGK